MQIENKYFAILVTDKGPGIPSNELSNIFQPFYRLDDSRSSEGFGPGLPLAFRILKMHKGEITTQSEVGKGTTFTIRIPSAKQNGF